jgi:hypothetical protein
LCPDSTVTAEFSEKNRQMKVPGISLHKLDARSTLIMLAADVMIFAVLMAVDHSIDECVDLPCVGLIFVSMSGPASGAHEISPKEAGWKGFVLQVISIALIIIGYVFATMS